MICSVSIAKTNFDYFKRVEEGYTVQKAGFLIYDADMPKLANTYKDMEEDKLKYKAKYETALDVIDKEREQKVELFELIDNMGNNYFKTIDLYEDKLDLAEEENQLLKIKIAEKEQDDFTNNLRWGARGAVIGSVITLILLLN